MTDFGIPVLLAAPSPEAAARMALDLHLKFVELNANFPECDLDALDPERLRALAARTGLYFTLHLPEALNPLDLSGALADAALRAVLRGIGLARAAGMPVVNMHLQRGVLITLPDQRVSLNALYEPIYMKRVNAWMDACRQALSADDPVLCIENTDGMLPHEWRALDVMLENPRVQLCYDIGHDWCARGADEPGLRARAARVAHMHAHDARGTHCHLALGEGEIDLDERLAFAKACGARVVLETKTPEALAASVRWLAARGHIQS